MEVMSANSLLQKKVNSLSKILLQKSRKEPKNKSRIHQRIFTSPWMKIKKPSTKILNLQLMTSINLIQMPLKRPLQLLARPPNKCWD
jgi:hypothetical protein